MAILEQNLNTQIGELNEYYDVKINCPEVLTLQLPKDEELIPTFLKNVWVFDHGKLTAVDKNRTNLYKESIQRENYQKSSLSLNDFLNAIEQCITTKSKISILSSNVRLLNFAYQYEWLRKVVNQAEIVLIDGVGVRVGAWLL